MTRLNRSAIRSAALATLAVLAVSVLVAGCGNDSESSDTNTSDTNTSDSGGSVVDEATARVSSLEEGLASEPPATGPGAQPGKEVWAISCGDIVESCKVVTDATVEAGEALGWSMTRFDAKFDPAQAATGIRQAIVDDADAVVVSAFDCVLIKSPLREAREAGVATYGSGATDCDDPVAGDGSESLFTLVDTLPPGTGPGYANFLRNWGIDKANYAIAETDGTAQTVNLEQADIPNVALISKGFAERLGECSECDVVETVKFTGADIENSNVTQALSNALNANPEATVVHIPYDGLTPSVASAIIESGRSDDLLVVGGEGFPGNLELIRSGGAQDASLAFDLSWESWAQMDDLNRHFAGEKPVYGGWGYTVIDKDTNLPESGGWDSNIDYRSAYRELWGR